MINLPVLLFDNSCGVCHWAVRFVLRHDRSGRFRFASLSGPLADRLVPRAEGNPRPDSIVLVDEGTVHIRSDAVLRILGLLGWPWRSLTVGRAIPRRWRDALYDLVAARRVNWSARFGLGCPVPTLAERARFVELDDPPPGVR